MDLNLFIYSGLAVLVALLFCNHLKQIRWVAFAGALFQILLAAFLFFQFNTERASGNVEEMLFTASYTWFKPLNIMYQVGADGITVAMILLTASHA